MVCFPRTWWCERPLIFAHRGASAVAPENTLAAFRRALEMGADGVELDVHLSADGVPVVMHDARVEATTDGTGSLVDLSLKELKSLDAGSWFAEDFAGEQIPTLEEVLADVGNSLLINIELKPAFSKRKGLEAAVADVVQRVGVSERVWFSSFVPYSLYRMRNLLPGVPCGFLYGGSSLFSWLFKSFTPFEAVHPEARLVTPALVRRAHKRGLRVITWTVDDADQARLFARWGVDGLITNNPAQLLRVLGEG